MRSDIKPGNRMTLTAGVRGLFAAFALMALLPINAQAEDISVEGRRSEENRFDYIWTVTNHSDKRIASLVVDHYYGKTVTPPDGWIRSNMTGNVAEKQPLEPGIIEFTAEKPLRAIGRGQSRDFKVNVDRLWRGHCERRTVTVGFEDGTTLEIPGVICPAEEDWFKKNVALVGLGAMFAIFVLWRVLFGKKSAPVETHSN
ncbi:MAG: hypothetical protein DHS20C16_04460 [Phycisphaerae bacterium]|nr:MAG: hypothetical protein DHS20C16_04460 [Phycisphaerae bacterium]